MKIKIKGATPENISQTIEDIMTNFEVDMYTANIYIDFTKNGVPVTLVNKDNEEIGLIRELDPLSKCPKMKIDFAKFITKTKYKIYQAEKEEKDLMELRQAEIERYMGLLYVGEKDNSYKLFVTTSNSNSADFKYTLKQKEKNGYKIKLIVKKSYVHRFFDHLKSKFKKEGKEVSPSSYPFFNLNSNDIEYIKSKADDIIKEVV